MQYYEINEQTARRANDVNSMSDYRPGSATEEYRAAVDKAAALVQARKAKISPYYHDKLDALLDRYARRLADYYNAYYRNESACPSILVCGGSNFPVRKKQKQNARRESLWQEYKKIDTILDKIRSVGTGAVDLTDPHARELLQDRLQQEQNALDYCKAANAYYRKHKTLRGYASLTDEQADAITDPEAFSIKLYGKPYGDFELSSLRGKIKRVQARLADLDKLQAAAQQPDNTTKFDGGEIVRNAEENRLQILFDEIPDADTRDALKSNGFRWSPRNKAWQRQLTQNAEFVVVAFPRPLAAKPFNAGQAVRRVVFHVNRPLKKLRVVLPQRLNFFLFHRRAEVAARLARLWQPGPLDHTHTFGSIPAPFIKRVVLFIFLVHLVNGSGVLNTAGFARVIANVLVDAAAAFPHLHTRRIVVAEFFLRSDLVLQGTLLEAVGNRGQRVRTETFFLQGQPVSVLVGIKYRRDLG